MIICKHISIVIWIQTSNYGFTNSYNVYIYTHCDTRMELKGSLWLQRLHQPVADWDDPPSIHLSQMFVCG